MYTYNRYIQMFPRDGTFLTKMGTQRSEDGQLVCPCGVAVDEEGNVIVADMSQRKSAQVFARRNRNAREKMKEG